MLHERHRRAALNTALITGATGLTRSAEQRERAVAGGLEGLAIGGLCYYARLESWFPSGWRRRHSHIVYGFVETGVTRQWFELIKLGPFRRALAIQLGFDRSSPRHSRSRDCTTSVALPKKVKQRCVSSGRNRSTERLRVAAVQASGIHDLEDWSGAERKMARRKRSRVIMSSQISAWLCQEACVGVSLERT
jgi:hypothetical protein